MYLKKAIRIKYQLLCAAVQLLLLTLLLPNRLQAQSLGDPVVKITFGSGTATRGGALAADSGSTTYTYTSGSVGEDQYTIANAVNTSIHGGFVTSTDHTGNTGGYMMIVNGSLTAGTVFTRTVTGLCGNTSYQFGVWIKNVLSTTGSILPNMVFHIYAADGTTELGSGVSTGDVPVGNVWHNYIANFTLPAGTQTVIIKLVSNASGQVGNDFAVDDITFSPYGSIVSAVIAPASSTTSTAITQSTCAGTSQTYTINATSTLASGYVQKLQMYVNGTWTDLTAASTATSFTVTSPSTAGTYLYRLVSALSDNISSAKCVVASNDLTITVSAAPTAIITPPSTTCLGNATSFSSANSTADGGSIASWLWNFGDGTTSTEQNPTHTYTTAGTFTVNLTLTSNTGCTATATPVTVTINQLATAAFNTSTPNCVNQAITLTDASAANSGTITSWLWDYGDGTTETRTNNQAFQHTYTATGSKTITLTITTDGGCTSTISHDITIGALPTASFTTPAICLSDGIATFTNTSTADDGTATYLWTFGDDVPANITAANPNTSTAKNGSHTYSHAGTYTVSLTVTSAAGCQNTASSQFTVNGSNPNAAFTLANTSVCSDHEVFVTNQSTVTPGSVTRVDVYWEYGVDNSVVTSYTAPTNGQLFRHSYPVFHTGNAQTYTIHMIAYSGATSNSCTGTADQTVTLLPVADLSFPALGVVCQGSGLVQLTAKENSGIAGTGTYLGTGVTNTSTGGTFNPSVSGAGTFPITYIFNVTNGCADTITQTVTVNPTPKVYAGANFTLLEGGTATMQATLTNAGTQPTITWSPSSGLSSTSELNPTVTGGTSDVTYTLTVTTAEGCSAVSYVTVSVLKTPVIPNTFTPNNDGRNDVWNIEYLSTYTDCTVDIFNRYGNKVYSSIGYAVPWDGRYNGSDLPAGVYYYIINRKHNQKLLSGSITIIR
ncbi:PKD domain-containing protein [Mucilaginibacter robiniae]|uniref:PKD domain-containing protein n=1 Tax=Mucilaginibacter robiniae TaxID=2728022 RepID=A0A7L5DU11_9SPHI|nr:PKD domain-containing protein [Mucilaginibacter robiniae]QJD94590.1 PKD domain-containing protein [Mucilaginibacter robiniae]